MTMGRVTATEMTTTTMAMPIANTISTAKAAAVEILKGLVSRARMLAIMMRVRRMEIGAPKVGTARVAGIVPVGLRPAGRA